MVLRQAKVLWAVQIERQWRERVKKSRLELARY